MRRRIVKINEESCTGCSLCVDACHEGAIGMRQGKAYLLRDDYCDGLGDCLPACPANAISFEEREALPYDEVAVQANMAARQQPEIIPHCAGTASRSLRGSSPVHACPGSAPQSLQSLHASPAPRPATGSALRQWPVQIRLAPPVAPWLDNAHLLIAADCTAYAYGAFHQDFMEGKVTLIGCPKLDQIQYTEKLLEILTNNRIASVEVARMSVPCCGGLEQAVQAALQQSGKDIPFSVSIITPDGSATTVVKEQP